MNPLLTVEVTLADGQKLVQLSNDRWTVWHHNLRTGGCYTTRIRPRTNMIISPDVNIYGTYINPAIMQAINNGTHELLEIVVSCITGGISLADWKP